MNDSAKAFAAQLKAARKKQKLSQRTLAEYVGLPQSHISNIENGKVDMRLSNVIEISRVLGLEPMLIPRRYMSAVKGLMQQKTTSDTFEPAFTLDDEDDDD